MKLRWIALTLLATLVAVPALADGEPRRLRIEIDDRDGERIDLEISTGWLGALLEKVDIDCEATDDRRTRRMARHLDNAGEGSRYRYYDQDGDDVLALRRDGRLRLETLSEDGDQAVVEMPWEAAECFLLGRQPEGGIGRLIAREGLRLKVDSRDDDGRVRVWLD
jgi:hypothetical protein